MRCREGVCALFNSIEEEVSACKAWIDAGSGLPPPAAEHPLLRDPAGLDRHLNRRLEDTRRMVRFVRIQICPKQRPETQSKFSCTAKGS